MLQTQIKALGQSLLSERDFPKIDKLISTLSSDVKKGKIAKSEILAINQSFGEEFLENTIQGYSLRKPFGYSGDFMMIDKIYKLHTSPIDKYKIWDEYFHRQPAPKAVRNRKDYFKQVLVEKMKAHPHLRLMNVASGPARDLFELYNEHQGFELITTCIDMDQHAIDYAKALNQAHLDKISFIHKNIFRHKEERIYDVIWSAGLFDYFNDKAFVMMLKRFKEWLKPKGEIVIGNFNENHNPSRDYMEIFGDWYLHHRTEEQLLELACKAGFNPQCMSVGREEENVNLFLHIQG